MMSKNPFGALALSLGVTLVGAFTLIMHTGISARENGVMRYTYNSKGEPCVASTYINDFERGAKVLKTKTAALYSGAFGGSSAPSSAPSAETASSAVSGEEEVYRRPGGYPAGYDEDEYPYEDPPDGGASGGAGFSSDFSSWGADSASSDAPPEQAASVPAGKIFPGKKKEAAVEGTSSPRGAFKGRPGKEHKSALERGYASLASEPGGELRAPDIGGGGSSQGSAAGGLSNFPGAKGQGLPSWGKNAKVSMGGGADGLRADAMSSYNSKMKAGASSAASAGPQAPKASGPAAVSSSSGPGSSSGSTGSGSSSAGSPAGKSSPTEKSSPVKKSSSGDPGDNSGSVSRYYPASVEEQSIFGSIVSEKRNGGEYRYLSGEDSTGDPEEGLLKSGGLPVRSIDKEFPGDDPQPDPPKLSNLSEARKKELKTEIHTFLKKVENKYGAMIDIFSTSCGLTPELCKEHELEGNYLTMTTVKGVKLVLGLKYQDERWQPYTIEFKNPSKNDSHRHKV